MLPPSRGRSAILRENKSKGLGQICDIRYGDVYPSMRTYRVLKMMLPFGTLVSFGLLCFSFAIG